MKNSDWFPISGCIILRGNVPIASTPFEKESIGLMQALASNNKGCEYTCISANGYWSKVVKEEEEDVQTPLDI